MYPCLWSVVSWGKLPLSRDTSAKVSGPGFAAPPLSALWNTASRQPVLLFRLPRSSCRKEKVLVDFVPTSFEVEERRAPSAVELFESAEGEREAYAGGGLLKCFLFKGGVPAEREREAYAGGGLLKCFLFKGGAPAPPPRLLFTAADPKRWRTPRVGHSGDVF